jgi:prefoldin subunit 5
MRQTEKLLNGLCNTERNICSLEDDVSDVQKVVTHSIDVLMTSKTINADLVDLDETIKLVSTILTPFTAIPIVGGGISITKKSLDTIDRVINPIRVQSDKVEKIIKPIRDSLKKVQSKIQIIQNGLKTSANYTTKIHDKVSNVNDCAIKNESSSVMDLLDGFSTPLNNPIDILNKTISECTKTCDTIEQKLNAVDKSMKTVVKVSHEIEKGMNILVQIKNALSPVKSALNKKISTSYGVKVKVKATKKKWYKVVSFWTWKTETQNFTFTVQQIINGINTGISFVQDALMKGAEDALKAIGVKMPSMHTIPFINDLEKELNSVANNMSVSKDLDGLEDNLRDIMDTLNTLKVSLDHFNIEC